MDKKRLHALLFSTLTDCEWQVFEDITVVYIHDSASQEVQPRDTLCF